MLNGADDLAFLRVHPPPSAKGMGGVDFRNALPKLILYAQRVVSVFAFGTGALLGRVLLRPHDMQDSKHSRKPWQDAATNWT